MVECCRGIGKDCMGTKACYTKTFKLSSFSFKIIFVTMVCRLVDMGNFLLEVKLELLEVQWALPLVDLLVVVEE
jgi:hypothetical protein